MRLVSSNMKSVLTALQLVLCLFAIQIANAQALPEPADPHPRLFAGEDLRLALVDLAGRPGSFVSRTVERCDVIGKNPSRFATDGYMGLDWAQYLQACLIAYRATGNERFGRTALVYFRALIDDLKVVGDGAGGDMAARRDSGYSIRALGPNAALAYDWLHDFPGVDEALRSRARQRFSAWTEWHLKSGYRARSPGTNYHAGYLFAATLISIAQGSEAGADGARLWRHVIEDIFEHDTLPAMRGNGVLVGGDWGEGWQYAPLSVVEYSMAASALSRYGLDVSAVETWLSDIVLRHVYGLLPGKKPLTFAVGDTQSEEANIPVRPETLAAVILGPASVEARRMASAEMHRLKLFSEFDGFPLFRSLAEASLEEPLEVPRDTLPTHYFAAGIGTLYARFDWTDEGVWFGAMCSRVRDVDHMHPNAGNFVLSRGTDAVIVDPSPYGTLSSLTSNAPTIESRVLPADYKPSQGYWSKTTGFQWIRQLGRGGILLARCEYADQFHLQDTPSDVSLAERDFVVVPGNNGRDAVVLLVDRAKSAGPDLGMHLRFRTLANLASNSENYVGSIGNTRLTIRQLFATSGTSELRRLAKSDCFQSGYTRGNCDAARFPVSEYRTRLDGPLPEAIHAIAASGVSEPVVTLQEEAGFRVALVELMGSYVVIVIGDAADRSFTIPNVASTVIALDEFSDSLVTAISTEAGCQIQIAANSSPADSPSPMVVDMDASCNLARVE